MSEKTMAEQHAATIRIRNLIVTVHECDDEVVVGVWPAAMDEEQLEELRVRYDSVCEMPCGHLGRVTDGPCPGDEDEDCLACRLLNADPAQRVSPYNFVLPCGKLEIDTKNCCGDKAKWDLCEGCRARIRIEVRP